MKVEWNWSDVIKHHSQQLKDYNIKHLQLTHFHGLLACIWGGKCIQFVGYTGIVI